MNKKMLIIYAIFALILSCKNYASGEDLKEQAKEIKQGVEQKVKGFLEAKKEELTEGLKNFGSEVFSKVKEELMQADASQGQLQEQVAQGVDEDSEDSKLKEEIEKKIKELNDKMGKSDDKTPIGTYSDYEKEVKEIREELKKLKDRKEDKEKLEKELKELEDSLKKKKDERKKSLEEAKRKLEEFKRQVESATGENTEKVKKQGKIGQEALRYAKEFCVNGSYSVDDGTNTDDFAKKVIDDALKNIDDELKKLEDKKEEKKK
ncbi:hypothetical protein [Borreliella japonica]|uniref:hypothetical protein n=1 Tax=Borreliella japonica TaxID=34095 RepID=UPI003AF1307C